jgi:biotin transporter BioY
LVALAAWLGWLASRQWTADAPNTQAAIVLGALGLIALAGAAWMGLRTVRGPEPPQLD